MNSRKTLFWAVVAAALFAFIYFIQGPSRKSAPANTAITRVNPEAVTSVQVRRGIQPEIRVDRTNQVWALTAPSSYRAQATSIEALLSALQQLTPAATISAAELRERPNADEEYGFSAPQASIVVLQPDYRLELVVGSKTPPGDQVFVQVSGAEGVHVVDASLLKLVPSVPNDWRDTALFSLSDAPVTRISVTNASRSFELQRDTNQLWRIAWPSQARADTGKIDSFLGTLQTLCAVRFVSDDPKPDLESFGLQPPDIEVAVAQGTNQAVLLQFSKTLTNDARLLYARCAGKPGVFAVSGEPVEPWRQASINELRDQHLLTLRSPVGRVDVKAGQAFSLVRQTNNTWRILPEDFLADSTLAADLIHALSTMEIVQFVKDVVPPPDLPQYGLTAPARAFILRAAAASAGSTNNEVLAELNFGAMQDGKWFVRRADENSVYAVSSNQVTRLPLFGWEMRDRQVCSLDQSSIIRLTLRQQGRTRQLVHNGPHSWSLAPGSQGVINDLAIDETVRALCTLRANWWTARNPKDLAPFGFSPGGHEIVLASTDGTSTTIEFGGESATGQRYARVLLNGEPWVFEFPWAVYRDVAAYLTVPVQP